MKKLFSKQILPFCFILLISVLFCLSYFSDSIYNAHDLTYHLNRLIGLKDAFLEGQFPVKVYPNANYGFGYAAPLFYCDLFFYPFAYLLVLGMDAVVAMKWMVFVFTVVTAGITFYVSRKIKNDYQSSVLNQNRLFWIEYLSVILYVFGSYRIFNVYTRGGIGEVIFLTFVPLVFYSFYEILIQHKDRFILLAVSFSCLVMSHLISTVQYGFLFAVFILLFTITNFKNKSLVKRVYFTIFKGTALAVFLCMWYLMPMFEQFLSQDFLLKNNDYVFTLNTTFQPLSSLFQLFSHLELKWSGIGNNDGAGFCLVFIPLFYAVCRKNRIITILMITGYALLMLPLGVIKDLSAINFMQFAFRFHMMIYPILVIVTVYVIVHIKGKISYVLAIFSVALSLINGLIVNVEALNHGNFYIQNDADRNEINSTLNWAYAGLDYNHDELGGAEYLPFTENNDYVNDDLKIKIVKNGVLWDDLEQEYLKENTKLTFTYQSDEAGTLVALPVSYYKGYRAYVYEDGEYVQIQCVNVEEYKRVGLYLYEGEYTYLVRYAGTVLQKLSAVISLLSCIAVSGYVIIKNKRHIFFS